MTKKFQKIGLVLLLSIILIISTGLPLLAGTQQSLLQPTPINQVFPDSFLAEKMRINLGKGSVTDLVTQGELDALTSVKASNIFIMQYR